MGLFQLTGDYERCAWMQQASLRDVNGCDEPSLVTKEACESLGHSWQRVSYEFYNASETQKRLSSFLNDDSRVACAIVEHQMTGYARSEILFQVITEILQEEGVQLGTSCDVTDLQPIGANGRIQVVSKSAPSGACTLNSLKEFDRVIVAASAASVPLLRKVDPRLEDHLIGVKGYGLQGGEGSPMIPQEQSGRGLHFMDESKRFEAAYARATEDLRVKVWGGHAVAKEDEELKPPYSFCSYSEEERIFRQGPSCASSLVGLPATRRLAGMRPVPSIGAVPMIKRYTGQWSNLFLNSGFGYNGYDLSWFASFCTVQWLEQGELEDPVCQRAVKVGREI
jgi:glycine/D-amino acid oxidase-like deaminating enzyme